MITSCDQFYLISLWSSIQITYHILDARQLQRCIMRGMHNGSMWLPASNNCSERWKKTVWLVLCFLPRYMTNLGFLIHYKKVGFWLLLILLVEKAFQNDAFHALMQPSATQCNVSEFWLPDFLYSKQRQKTKIKQASKLYKVPIATMV